MNNDTIKLIGLLVFLFPLFHSKSRVTQIIALIVIINGILCHGSAIIGVETYNLCRIWDILVNVGLVTYINMNSKWKPWTMIGTFTSITLWQLNNRLLKKNPILHTAGVQLPLCIALCHFS